MEKKGALRWKNDLGTSYVQPQLKIISAGTKSGTIARKGLLLKSSQFPSPLPDRQGVTRLRSWLACLTHQGARRHIAVINLLFLKLSPRWWWAAKVSSSHKLAVANFKTSLRRGFRWKKILKPETFISKQLFGSPKSPFLCKTVQGLIWKFRYTV